MMRAGVDPPTVLNHCAEPPWVIADDGFNIRPSPLSLQGVRRSHRGLFAKLRDIADPRRRGEVFHEYLTVTFALHHWATYQGRSRRSLRNSYVRFLRGWGVDSNGIEGAVLKSWVQSRFGLAPTYHRQVLPPGGEENARFAFDRMKGRQRTNAIDAQLDLLYEFAQYELARRWPDRPTLTLYRGTNDPEEHPVRARQPKRMSCVRLNNLVSFTADREKAWEFGSTVWEATVAAAKVIFFSGLLPDSLLYGESEYLVIGGDYWVRELLY